MADDNIFNPFATAGSDSGQEPVKSPQSATFPGGNVPPLNLPFKDAPQSKEPPVFSGRNLSPEKQQPVPPPSSPATPQGITPPQVLSNPLSQPKIEEKASDIKDEPLSTEPLILRSSIRTMRDDFAAIQKGQSPAGVKAEKIAEQQPKYQKDQAVSQQSAVDEIYSQVELGDIERARTLEGEKPKSFRLVRPEGGSGSFSEPNPPTPITTPGPISEGEVRQRRDFSITDKKPLTERAPGQPRPPRGPSLFDGLSNLFKFGRKSKDETPMSRVPRPPAIPGSGVNLPPIKKMAINPKLAGLVGILVLLLGFTWFLFIREPSQTIVFESPTPELTTTPSLSPEPTQDPGQNPLIEALGEISKFVFPSTADPLSTLNNFVQSLSMGPKETRAYLIEDETGIKLALNTFLAKFLVTIPANVISTIDENSFNLLVYSPETNGGSKEIGIIIRSRDSIKTSSALRVWEGTLSEDLDDIFNFDPQKAATAGFLDNIYNGVSIRYRNFPLPVDTIDYAVVTMPSGDHYLIIINSRESIYSLIDKLLGT